MAQTSSYRFDHIAVGVWSIADAVPFLEDELGGKPLGGAPNPVFASAQWEFANGGVLEALDPPPFLDEASLNKNFMHQFLTSGGPRVHHVTFKVPNLDEAIASAEEKGWKVVGVNKQSPSWKEAFIHPKQEGVGIVVQLAEHRPELRPPWLVELVEDPSFMNSMGSHYKRPSFESDHPSVSVVGLHLSVRNRDAAMRLWRDTIKGTPEQISSNVVAFSWQESPMKIFIHFNDASDEGVMHVELQQARPWKQNPSTLMLTQRSSSPLPHPVIGAPFLLTAPSTSRL